MTRKYFPEKIHPIREEFILPTSLFKWPCYQLFLIRNKKISILSCVNEDHYVVLFLGLQESEISSFVFLLRESSIYSVRCVLNYSVVEDLCCIYTLDTAYLWQNGAEGRRHEKSGVLRPKLSLANYMNLISHTTSLLSECISFK